MKIAPAQINDFLKKPDPAVRIVLLYGPDAGLVCERAGALARTIVPDVQDPFRVGFLTGTMIAELPSCLADEMAAQALGGGQRLIRLQYPVEGMAVSLAALVKDMPPGDSFLLIEAGDLEKRSKIRGVCENEGKIAAAIACYVEEGAARQRIIGDILRAEGLHAPRNVLMFLCDVLPPDRRAMRSELEKLALYAKDQKEITMEDAQASVHDAGAAELDDLVFAVGSGDRKQASILLDRLYSEQTSTVAILRAAQRHFLRLQWARAQMDDGLSADVAIKKLQPPVFWKYAGAMTSQLRRWPLGKLDQALRRLLDTEAAVKRTGMPDEALCAQLLLALAS
jgi:DNA polymerase-3 subunit delta